MARGWKTVGTISERGGEGAGRLFSLFYYWNGERPLDPNAPQLHGVGEVRLDSSDRASGYFTTRSNTDPHLNARTSGVYWRADPDDLSILDGREDRKRAALIAERLANWKSVRDA